MTEKLAGLKCCCEHWYDFLAKRLDTFDPNWEQVAAERFPYEYKLWVDSADLYWNEMVKISDDYATERSETCVAF